MKQRRWRAVVLVLALVLTGCSTAASGSSTVESPGTLVE